MNKFSKLERKLRKRNGAGKVEDKCWLIGSSRLLPLPPHCCATLCVCLSPDPGVEPTLSCVFARLCANVSADVKHVWLCRRVLHFTATFLCLTVPRTLGATQAQTQETQLATQQGDGRNLYCFKTFFENPKTWTNCGECKTKILKYDIKQYTAASGCLLKKYLKVAHVQYRKHNKVIKR